MALRLVGRLDMLVWQDRPRPGWVHFQTKTVSAHTNIPTYVAALSMSDHERIYNYLAHTDEQPLVGSVANLIIKRVTGPKPKGKPRQVTSDWYPFERHYIPVSENQIKDALKAANWTAEQIVKCERVGEWPRYTNSCVVYNRKCDFYDECRSGVVCSDVYLERERDYVDELSTKHPNDQVLNVSRIHTFRDCPRLYYNRYVRRLDRFADAESPKQLTFGTAIHEALRAWYSPKHEDEGEGEWHPCLDDSAAIEAMMAVFRQHPGHDDQADDVHTSGYARLLMQRYFERWRKHDEDMVIRGVEHVLERQVPEGGLK